MKDHKILTNGPGLDRLRRDPRAAAVRDDVVEMQRRMMEGESAKYEKPFSPTEALRGLKILGPKYDAKAVDDAIASSSRSGRKVGKREARAIHSLLKGRG